MLINDANANWGYSGATALAEHLHQIEEDIGEEIELDLVSLRCDFARYDSLSDWAESYFGLNKESKEEKIRDYIQDHGTLIEFTGGIIVSQF